MNDMRHKSTNTERFSIHPIHLRNGAISQRFAQHKRTKQRRPYLLRAMNTIVYTGPGLLLCIYTKYQLGVYAHRHLSLSFFGKTNQSQSNRMSKSALCVPVAARALVIDGAEAFFLRRGRRRWGCTLPFPRSRSRLRRGGGKRAQRAPGSQPPHPEFRSPPLAPLCLRGIVVKHNVFSHATHAILPLFTPPSERKGRLPPSQRNAAALPTRSKRSRLRRQ